MTKTTARQSPLALILISVLSLAGVGVSIALSQHFYELRGGAASFHSYCNVGAAMNCDVVAASRYAEIFMGLPLSSFAGGWLLGIFLVAVLGYNVYWRRETTRAIFAMSAFGLICSVVWFVVMAAVIKTYCLLCLITDGINIGLLGAALALKPEGFAKHPADAAKWKPIGLIVGGALFATVIGLHATLSSEQIPADTAKETVEQVLNSPVLPVSTGSEFPSIGPANAPVTIAEFSDFQCPFCRMGALTVNALLARYPGKIRVVFHNFPLNPSCNRKIDRAVHAAACDLAKAAVCANRQGKFKELYEAFFEDQTRLATVRPLDIAKEQGLDAAALESCSASADVGAAISRDVEEGIQLGVESTPTFFVNGHKWAGAYPEPIWEMVIEKLLGRGAPHGAH